LRAVIQRVIEGRVSVNGKVVGSIQKGVVILLGVKTGDTEADAKWLADKCVCLRIFENDEGKFHHSLLDVEGEILVVSQFTLYGDCRKGRRPSFTEAADPKIAESLYQYFVDLLREHGLRVETGIFAARMQVEIVNDGPVTLIIDTKKELV
jgi:D-tyrosyl-tRNA(Tyr) deacylase